jgi:hypothetical protein
MRTKFDLIDSFNKGLISITGKNYLRVQPSTYSFLTSHI